MLSLLLLVFLGLGMAAIRLKRRRQLMRLSRALGAQWIPTQKVSRKIAPDSTLNFELRYGAQWQLRIFSFASLISMEIRNEPFSHSFPLVDASLNLKAQYHCETEQPEKVAAFFRTLENQQALEAIFASSASALKLQPWGIEILWSSGDENEMYQRIHQIQNALAGLSNHLLPAIYPAMPPAKNEFLTSRHWIFLLTLPVIQLGLYQLGGQLLNPRLAWLGFLKYGLFLLLPALLGWTLLRIHRKPLLPSRRLPWMAGTIVGNLAILALAFPSVVALNRLFDRSPSDSHAVILQHKSAFNSLWGTRYQAAFTPWCHGSNLDSVPISFSEFTEAIPEKTQLILFTHPGFLGWEWASGHSLQTQGEENPDHRAISLRKRGSP